MELELLMEQKGLTMYRLSKNSGIPYTTVNDICSGRAKLEKCSAETVYKLAKELGVSMEELLSPYMNPRISFELYKSNLCHRLKEIGDIEFMIEILEKDHIRSYYEKKWYPESLYLLAMLDYISRVNGIPLCSKYDDLRMCKLQERIYPSSIVSMCQVIESEWMKEEACCNAIPEFMRFNIVESEVYDVV